MHNAVNPFLVRLLAQQQDGAGAVSAPSNWDAPPLLNVETPLSREVDRLADALTAPIDEGTAGAWHFFVGSPGNGKSAATGQLVRRLTDLGLSIADAAGNALPDLPRDRPPYKLKVYEAGKPYPRAYIAQDASVLPDPFSNDADPAASLVNLLKDAVARGVSLVVCTNRGVLERAYASTYLDRLQNQTDWFQALRIALGLSHSREIRLQPDRAKQVHKSITVSATPLDRTSLVLGADTLERLVDRAVSEEYWQACRECSSASRCPFFLNREWLSDPPRTTNFLKIVRRAEVYSGRVIVFREAVALISAILAGCPRDIDETGPCGWVHKRISDGDVFALLSKRIYAVLFSAYSPVCFESDDSLRGSQLRSLAGLETLIDADAASTRTALERARSAAISLSSDVGAERLLGHAGVFRKLDFFNELIGHDFHARWGEDAAPFAGGKWCSELERVCSGHWDRLRNLTENSPGADSSTHHSLVRWISAFTYRAGALLEGRTAFDHELDELIDILSGRPMDIARKRELRTSLAEALELGVRGAEISRYGYLKGNWSNQHLRPEIKTGGGDASRAQALALVVAFSGQEFLMPASAYVWLRRRANWGMLLQLFPHEVLRTARDALSSAASRSGYDLAKDDVEVVIKLKDGRLVHLVRDGDEVLVDGF